MNENIKQVWYAALDKAVPETYTQLNEHQLGKAIDAFAEMLIEQCIAQCWTVSELEHNGYVVSECSKRVRKHFGVE